MASCVVSSAEEDDVEPIFSTEFGCRLTCGKWSGARASEVKPLIFLWKITKSWMSGVGAFVPSQAFSAKGTKIMVKLEPSHSLRSRREMIQAYSVFFNQLFKFGISPGADECSCVMSAATWVVAGYRQVVIQTEWSYRLLSVFPSAQWESRSQSPPWRQELLWRRMFPMTIMTIQCSPFCCQSFSGMILHVCGIGWFFLL